MKSTFVEEAILSLQIPLKRESESVLEYRTRIDARAKRIESLLHPYPEFKEVYQDPLRTGTHRIRLVNLDSKKVQLFSELLDTI